MKKNDKNKKILIVLLLVLLIGIGYAALVSNLNINGYANMKSNYFDIHFDNVTYNEENVIINTLNGEYNATIDPNDNTVVNYSVALSKPGDLYEFNVDAVNNGTMEGEIAEIISTLKINNAEPIVIEEDGSNLPDYLEYNLTYLDGTKIEGNQTLESGERVTYKVRLKFKEDIEPEDLPQEVKVLAFGMRSMFRQAPKMAAAPAPEPEPIGHYTVNSWHNIGDIIQDDPFDRSTPQEAMSDWKEITCSDGFYYPFYLKHILNDNNEIIESYIGFIINDEIKNEWLESCGDYSECSAISNLVNGVYTIKGGDSGESYAKNVETIKKAYNYSVQPDICSFDDNNNQFWCGNYGTWSVTVGMSGDVNAYSNGYHCDVSEYGNSSCTFQ